MTTGLKIYVSFFNKVVRVKCEYAHGIALYVPMLSLMVFQKIERRSWKKNIVWRQAFGYRGGAVFGFRVVCVCVCFLLFIYKKSSSQQQQQQQQQNVPFTQEDYRKDKMLLVQTVRASS